MIYVGPPALDLTRKNYCYFIYISLYPHLPYNLSEDCNGLPVAFIDRDGKQHITSSTRDVPKMLVLPNITVPSSSRLPYLIYSS